MVSVIRRRRRWRVSKASPPCFPGALSDGWLLFLVLDLVISGEGRFSGLRPCLVRRGSDSRSNDYLIEYNPTTMTITITTTTTTTTTTGSGCGGVVSLRPQWAVVAGIRSTGLTASLAIGEHVANLLLAEPAQSSTSSLLLVPSPPSFVVWPVLPSVSDLCASFADRNDGCVDVTCRLVRAATAAAGGGVLEGDEEGGGGGGSAKEHSMTHRVTHPQTRFALATRPPFLPIATAPCLRPLKEALATIAAASAATSSKPSPQASSSPLAVLTGAASVRAAGGLTNAVRGSSAPGAATAATVGRFDQHRHQQ